jgi:hypothetical protein
MDGTLLAVGAAGGLLSGFDGWPDEGGAVRLGDRLVPLDTASYRLWDATHVAPTEAALCEWSTHADIAQPRLVLDELRDTRLVLDWAAEPPESAALSRTHTVKFVGHCLGNGTTRSPMLWLGDTAKRPVARVDLLLYEFLTWADGTSAISEQCAGIEARYDAEMPDPVEHVLRALPALMRFGLVQVDVYPRGTED